jgi:ribonuclease-3 family protein
MNLKDQDQIIQQVPSLALAYLGDAVYELLVRQFLVSQGLVKVNQLHQAAVRFVKAASQAQVLRALEPELSETELLDYKYATAFEALMGYLYLTEQTQRQQEIFQKALAVLATGERENGVDKDE